MINLCRNCGSKNICVIDSRDTRLDYIRRRRRCEACDARFTTFEVREEVYKKSGAVHQKKFEAFDTKLRQAIQRYVKTLDAEQQIEFFNSISGEY